MSLKVKKLSADAQLPTRGSDGAAGYDLQSIESCVILPGKRAVVATGLSIELPPGVYGRIAPRSGLAVKHGIQVGAGVVDADYRGEVKVVLFNHDSNPYLIKPGYRIAQLILERCETPDVEEILDSSDTVRGQGGFGSTGQ
jgi:dUTP pyrophosphatase